MFSKSQLERMKSKKLALACSGGIDSMVLAHLLLSHSLPFSIIHCNFQLRGLDSDSDEAFVCNFAKNHNLSFYSSKFNAKQTALLNGTSIEMEARNLRYHFFKELILQEKFDLVLLAHHQDDQAETIFMRLIKGAGLTGISGMREYRDDIYYRPLLNIPKVNIIKYAQENNIDFREDVTNKEDIYLRNKIRNQILPLIEEINPSFKHALIHLGNLSSQTISLLDDISSSLFENWLSAGKLDLQHFSGKSFLPLLVSYFLDKEILHKDQMDDIISCLQSNESKIFKLKSYKIEVKNFLISKINEISSDPKIYKTLNQLISDYDLILEVVKEAPKVFKENCLYLDIDKLKFPIQFRPFQNGDKIKPLAMGGQSRKLSDIGQELNWSKSEKLSNKVFLDSDHEIIAILGYRIAEKVKLDSSSKHILIINK